MSTVVELANLESSGFTIIGDSDGDYAGWSVSDVGDFNGDGFEDFIIGAPFDEQSSYTGAAYLIFGRSGGFGDVDLGNLQPDDGIVIQGSYGAFLAGANVSGAGDVNGDGFDDVIVGATEQWYDFYDPNRSTAYVIFGRETGPANIDLGSPIAPPEGFAIFGEERGRSSTMEVSNAGDVNGDGFDDIIVGVPYGAGAAHVIFGKPSGFGTIDLTNLPLGSGFQIIGSYDYTGRSVSGAGDVNGDGLDDIIIGARYGSSGGAYSGEAYVIFGRTSGFGTISLSNLAPASGFIIQGSEAFDYAGWSVSAAGDINGDGFDDVIVGAAYADSNHELAGAAYVIFGKPSGFATIDLSNLAPGFGFAIFGDDTADHAGWSVSAAGDVNNDGFDDLIVGAPQNDNTRDGGDRVIDAGEAYVIFGKASGFGTIDLTNLDPSAGFIVQGEAGDDQVGFSVSGAGDIDGDGFDDLIIGAPYNDRGGSQAGAAYVISGKLHLATDVRNDFNGDGRSDVLWRNDIGQLSDWLGLPNGGFQINDFNAFTTVSMSWSVVGTGDFDGDSRDDLLWRNMSTGALSNWLGKPNGGFQNNDAKAFTTVPLAWTIVGIGDFDGNGRDDILWCNTTTGQLSNWLGQSGGRFVVNDANALVSVPISWTVAGTGDFNADGLADVLWRNTATGQLSNWLGTESGGFLINDVNALTSVSTNWQVVGTGDFNGDGRDDILWRRDTGQLSNWLGTGNGRFQINDAAAFTTVSTNWNVVEVGDYNGDGNDDILWRSDTGQLSNWLGTGSGGFQNNDARAFTQVETTWVVQVPTDVLI